MKRYKLRIELSFEAADDVEARKHADRLDVIDWNLADAKLEESTKLQEIYPDKPPRRINWES